MVQWCWVNFQCRGVLLIWIILGQGPTALVVGAGGSCLNIFSLIDHFSLLPPSLWETTRYRLQNCLKGPLNPKQPTNQSSQSGVAVYIAFPYLKQNKKKTKKKKKKKKYCHEVYKRNVMEFAGVKKN